jgi:Xaa-Pro aminopeptidase
MEPPVVESHIGAGARKPPPRGFSTGEYEARTARAQAMMAEAGIDVLLLTTEPEVRYFTGFLSRFWLSPTRPWFVVVPTSGKPVAVVPAIGKEAFARTWLDDVRTWPSPRPDDEGISELAAALGEFAGPTARIGIPQGPETHLRMPLRDFRALREQLPKATFADATPIISALRMIKTKAEVDKIAHACALVGDVFSALPSLVAPGMTEAEISKRFKIACLEAGVDEVDYLAGGSGADIISPPTDRIPAPGDVFMLDTGAVFDGYYCDFDRNYAVGTVPEEAASAYAVLLAAGEAGLAAARPGASCADLFSAMYGVLVAQGAGAQQVGRLGHGLGMQLTEWPSITPDDRTVLRPGMVLTLEPSLTLAKGKAMVHEENIVIAEDGARLLTRPAPDTLPPLAV